MKSLCKNLLSNSSFLSHLAEHDKEEADRLKGKSCSCCQEGVLHSASYPRKPRGLGFPLTLLNTRRISFCCSECRKRTTPPSLQFFGRKIYSSLIIILALLLRSRDPRETLSRIRGILGVSERTIERWRGWLLTLLEIPEWKVMRQRLSPTFSLQKFPSSLLVEFQAEGRDHMDALFNMMKFLVLLPL